MPLGPLTPQKHGNHRGQGGVLDRIAILGMGAIGASIGLALKRAGLKETEIVGAHSDREALSKAMKMGAVDRTTSSLKTALSGAQMVVLSTPLAETKETLEAIGPLLEEDSVVTDTGMGKVRVMEWAQSYLPHSTSFVGGRPLPRTSVTALDDARADFFDGTYYCIVSHETADPESVKSVVGLVEAIGARLLFMDPHEHDSYTAAVALVPHILSYALVGSTTRSASWKDIQRLAGAEYAEASRLAATDPLDSALACLASSDSMVYWLDQIIDEITSCRDLIREGSDGLNDKLISAWEERARWEAGSVEDESGFDAPSSGQNMASMMFGRHLTDRYRQLTSPRKLPVWKYRRADPR